MKADSVPSLAAANGWLNSPPLTPQDLKGKVVIYDFWTYSCVNCVRTLPHLKALYDRYASDGLVVIGIHSPEFDFEKNHDNVAKAVKDLGVTWPVAFDDNMADLELVREQLLARGVPDRPRRQAPAGVHRRG